MKYASTLFLLLFAFTASAQEANKSMSDLIFESQDTAFKNLIDSVSYNKKNIVMVSQDGTRIRKSQKDIDDALEAGSQFYKDQNYKDAFSKLSEVAAMGNKEAQAIVGLMFLQGQYVEKSTVTGMGWLGVANEKKNKKKNKTAKKAYKQVYSQLSEEHQKIIDATVADYVAKFGMDTQNYICKKVKPLGSNIAESVCVKSADSESPLYPVI